MADLSYISCTLPHTLSKNASYRIPYDYTTPVLQALQNTLSRLFYNHNVKKKEVEKEDFECISISFFTTVLLVYLIVLLHIVLETTVLHIHKLHKTTLRHGTFMPSVTGTVLLVPVGHRPSLQAT